MGDGAKTLRIAALSVVHSTAEYCAPVWCRSAHIRLIDSVLNDALRMVTGCLRPIPTDNLPILAGIQQPGLHRQVTIFLLVNRNILDYEHLLHDLLVRPFDGRQDKLKSRSPFVPAARKLSDNALFMLVSRQTLLGT